MRLNRYERKILTTLADTLIPPNERFPEKVSELGVIKKIEDRFDAMSIYTQIAFRITLVLINWAAILFEGGTFLFLSIKKKESYLEKWRHHFLYPVRLAYKLSTAVIYTNYYSHPEVSSRLGYTPPKINREQEIPPHISSLEKETVIDADVCVIGSGAGGAVVAKELAEKGHSVVLLEEGGYFTTRDFGEDPIEIHRRMYQNGGAQFSLGKPSIMVVTGKAVGGTTVINSGTCFRLPDAVYDRWSREFGLKDLSPSLMKPYFDKVEQEIHVAPVTDQILGHNAKIFKKGLEALGHQGKPLLRNAVDCRGAGNCCWGCPNDAKQSMQLSYIPKAIKAGVKLYSHCRVETIHPYPHSGGDVIGWMPDAKDKLKKHPLKVRAKVVVLAAGTFKTPYLLKKNGIVSYNAHVGRHLTIHPTGKVGAIFEEEVRGWEGVPQGFSYDGMKDEKVMLEGIFTSPSIASIFVELPIHEHRQLMEAYSNLAVFGFMISDESRGLVRWLPNGDPLIFYNLSKKDVEAVLKAIRFMSKVFLAAGAKEVLTGIPGAMRIRSQAEYELLQKVKVRREDVPVTAFHPLGTCRMGADPKESVVNSFGELHDVPSLFIADGSIFPSSLGVNPQETIMAFATRIAEHIHQEKLHH